MARRKNVGVEVDGLWFAVYPPNKYYWCKRPCTSLHRYVWTKANGEIPEGFQIHHRDGDPANNSIENLELVECSDHARHHAVERGIGNAESAAYARRFASEWHKSPEGRAWHRVHGKEVWVDREVLTHNCTHCGKSYEVKKGARKRGFCSMSCQGMARRASGVDDVVRSCPICGSAFVTNKYAKPTKTCSKACWKEAISRAQSRLRHHRGGGA